jgi:hypothetical protein
VIAEPLATPTRFVSLTFSPLTQRATFLAALERDLDKPAVRRRHIAFVTDQLLHLVALS